MRIALTLLGRFAVAVEGEHGRQIDIASPRLRALIAYLAMQPDMRETREKLADLLWGDRFDRQARHSLRQALMVLRRELATVGWSGLQVDKDTVCLDPATVSIDAREFLACAASDDPDKIERAAELYLGAFLAGLALDVEPFDLWVQAQRGRLAVAATAVFERASGYHDARDNGARAIAMAERLVDLDPLDERNQRALVSLLARRRGRSAALQAAEALRQTLRRELDAEPEAETQALVAGIKAGDTPPLNLAPAAARLPEDIAAPALLRSSGAGTSTGAAPSPWYARHRAMAVGSVALVTAGAALTFGLSLWGVVFVHQPKPAGPVVSYDGAWNGSISCAKLSFTRNPVKTTIAIGIYEGVASFSRPVYDPETVLIAGNETGKGTVAPNGAISIATTYPYPVRRTFTGSYSGFLKENRGELQGVQIFRYDDKSEERDCSIEITRETAR